MNNTTNKGTNTEQHLDYLIPLFFLFVLLLFVLFYCLKSGLFRRYLVRFGLCPTELTSIREPLLDEERAVAWRSDRGGQWLLHQCIIKLFIALIALYCKKLFFWLRSIDEFYHRIHHGCVQLEQFLIQTRAWRPQTKNHGIFIRLWIFKFKVTKRLIQSKQN